jgi:hypothetical protein
MQATNDRFGYCSIGCSGTLNISITLATVKTWLATSWLESTFLNLLTAIDVISPWMDKRLGR